MQVCLPYHSTHKTTPKVLRCPALVETLVIHKLGYRLVIGRDIGLLGTVQESGPCSGTFVGDGHVFHELLYFPAL